LLSNSDLAAIFTPIVVAITLTGWISAVYYANAHPRHRPKRPIKTEVSGGAFHGRGGRQLMPIPGDWTQDVPAPRGATASESYRVPEEEPSAATQPADDISSAEAETRPLAGHPPR
jgi:hypothetical protein